MIEIDGSAGEGGGQILRSALTLALITGIPFSMVRIRAGRPRPGLQRQHLAAVRAAVAVSQAEVSGDALGSQRLELRPAPVRGGAYTFATGSAGSCTLVLQTVLLPLLRADAPSRLVLEGGTHNPWAPPFEFLEHAFLPLLRRMGGRVTARLVTPGFYPAGGGRIEVEIEPSRLAPLELPRRGEMRRRRAVAMVSRLPRTIAERELEVVRSRLGLAPDEMAVEDVASRGPGNAVLVLLESEHITEVCTACGEKGVPAQRVAAAVATEAGAYLRAGVPVGLHLADQLLLPLAVGGGGAFVTLAPTSHTQTNAEVLRRFLDTAVVMTEIGEGAWEIRVTSAGGIS
jgi:RNA 3'-terminal phosphate cyclase (ATP)